MTNRTLLALCAALIVACGAPPDEPGSSAAPADVDRPSGLVVSKLGAAPGYVLYAPAMSDTTYLIDAEGLLGSEGNGRGIGGRRS